MYSRWFSLKSLAPALGLAALAALGPCRAVADTFTVTVTGTITSITVPANPIPNPFGVGVQAGTPFTETFTWDRSVVGTAVTPLHTNWETHNIAQGASIAFGGVRVTPFQNTNQALTSPFQPDYSIRAAEYNGNGAGKPPSVAFVSTAGLMTGADSRLRYETTEMALYDPTDAATVSLTDPGADWRNPSLTGSEYNFFATDASNFIYGISGTVNSVAFTAPEPPQCAGLALGALGLAGLAFKARRRGSPCPRRRP